MIPFTTVASARLRAEGKTVRIAMQIPANERHTAFIVNRVEGMAAIHYGDPHYPHCIHRTERPWLTTWFIDDVTCKRCLRLMPVLRPEGGAS